MCGIVGLHLREPTLYPQLGALLTDMLGQMCDRGPDSAGIAVYGDHAWSPAGQSTVSLLDSPHPRNGLAATLSAHSTPGSPDRPSRRRRSCTAPSVAEDLAAAAQPRCRGAASSASARPDRPQGRRKPRRPGEPVRAADGERLAGCRHTRMATESAVTAEGSHPFSVGPDQCLVHNGSFSNHISISRSSNVTASSSTATTTPRSARGSSPSSSPTGVDLEKALLLLNETFDGFYTLLVSTADSFAVVRDAISCKPAVIAETDQWVAMASEYRALADLPGVDNARIFEPEPEEVYVWHR